MTDTNTKPAAGGKPPALIAYLVRDREGGKGIFTPIGAAWPHKKGNGFNIQFYAAPLDGRVVLLPPSEKKN